MVQYQIKADQVTLETFTVEIGLNQGDALSSILFNIALKKAVREMQRKATIIEINQ